MGDRSPQGNVEGVLRRMIREQDRQIADLARRVAELEAQRPVLKAKPDREAA